jgi:phytanoyl-CoA hydroxylase
MRTQENKMKFEIFDETPWPEDQLVPLEVSKGTLILLHGLLPHRSFENRSTRSRQAYTLHLMKQTAQYPADNWLQRSATPTGFYPHKGTKSKKINPSFCDLCVLIAGS